MSIRNVERDNYNTNNNHNIGSVRFSKKIEKIPVECGTEGNHASKVVDKVTYTVESVGKPSHNFGNLRPKRSSLRKQSLKLDEEYRQNEVANDTKSIDDYDVNSEVVNDSHFVYNQNHQPSHPVMYHEPVTVFDESKIDSVFHDTELDEMQAPGSRVFQNEISNNLHLDDDRAIVKAAEFQRLGIFYIVNSENFEKAEMFLNKALDARIKLYGSNDLRVAETLATLAHVHVAQNNKEGAVQKYEDALNIVKDHQNEKSLRDMDLDLTKSKSRDDYMSSNHLHKILIQNLSSLGVDANNQIDQEKHPSSKDTEEVPPNINDKDYLTQALKTRLKIYGENDIHVAETQVYLADVLASENDLNGAMVLYSKALSVVETLCKDKDKEFLQKCYVLKRRPGKRGYINIEYIRDALKEKLRKTCALRAASRKQSLGEFYSQVLKKNREENDKAKHYNDKAKLYFTRALETRTISDEGETMNVVINKTRLGDVMVAEGNREESLKYYSEAQKIVKSLCDRRIKLRQNIDSNFLKKEYLGVKNLDLVCFHQRLNQKLKKFGIRPKPHMFCERVKKIAPDMLSKNSHGRDIYFCSSEEFNTDVEMPVAVHLGNGNYKVKEDVIEKTNEKEDEEKKEEEKQKAQRESELQILKGNEMYELGKIFDAKAFFDQHLDSWIQIMGDDHECLIHVRENLGNIFFLLKKFDKALDQYELALEMLKGTLNEEYVRLLHKKAVTCLHLMDEKLAVESFEKALKAHKEINGDTHPETEEKNLSHLLEEASICYNMEDFDTAKLILAKALTISEENGDKHDSKILNMFGMVLYTECEYHEAIHYFKRAFHRAEEDDKQVVNILYNLGHANIQIMNLDGAIVEFEKALEFLPKSNMCDFERRHEKIRLYTKIGVAYFHLGDLDDAYNIFLKAYEIENELFHNVHESLNIRYYMALTRSHQYRFDDALNFFTEILKDIHEGDGWTDEILLAQIHLDICEIFLLWGSSKFTNEEQLQKCRTHYKEALNIFLTKKLQADHPVVLHSKNLEQFISHETQV